MGLQSLERRLERMVEGVFRGSRSGIRPIELGRRLVREMDDQRSVDVKGRRVVPNDFVIKLNQRDYDGFADIHDVLQAELVEAAREYAREEGYHFMGPVRVELTVDESLKGGRFTVLTTLRQAAGGVGAGSLILPSGQRVPLGDRPVTIGRLGDCTVPLNDQNVSRRHAQISPGRGAYVVGGHGATNRPMVYRTRLNGEQRLADGDILSFGSTYVRFEAS
jgi:hypothetical protein